MTTLPTPSVPDAAQFFSRLLLATRAGRVDWTPGWGNDKQLVAQLGNGYEVSLTLVPDLDGFDEEPDHVAEVVRNGERLFSLDRRILPADELSKHLGEEVEFVYTKFKELWELAHIKSIKLDEHLKALNELLG